MRPGALPCMVLDTYRYRQEMSGHSNGNGRSVRLVLLGCLGAVALTLAYMLGASYGGPRMPATYPKLRQLVCAERELPEPSAEYGLGVGLRVATGKTRNQPDAPMSAEAYHHYAKLKQEFYCQDSAPKDVEIKGYVTPLNDSANTVLLRISPQCVLNVYGGAEDIVSQTLIAGRQWESADLNEVLWALRTPLPPNATRTSDISPGLFVDIGANVGAFTFNVAAAGYEVIAIEGMASNQKLLRTALCYSAPAVRDRVTIHGFGVGAQRRTCYLIAGFTNKGDGIALCNADNATHAMQLNTNPSYTLRGAMDVERVDDLVQRDVKVMKVDVEGFEPFVFQGMRRLLQTHTVWFLLVEYNKVLLDSSLKNSVGHRLDFVLDLLRLGYRISTRSFQGPFLTEEQLRIMDSVNPHSNSNLFMVHPRFNHTGALLAEVNGR